MLHLQLCYLFREAFGRIHELRSVCKENLPVLALTATADSDISELIRDSVNLSKRTKIICSSPDRPNIRLSVVKLKTKSLDCLYWIIDLLTLLSVDCPKIIIYCRSITLVGWLVEKLLCRLGDAAYLHPENKNSKDLLVGIYHSETSVRNKEKVLNSLITNGIKRIIIATSSLGCGINCKDVKYIVHFGYSFGLADYCQQIGRAGRESEMKCHAILYTYHQGGKKIIQEDIISYAGNSSKKCLRVTLFSPFNEEETEISPILPKHDCCCFCSKTCSCERCPHFQYETSAEQDPPKNVENTIGRIVTDNDKTFLFSLIEEYRENILKSESYLFAPVSTVIGINDYIVSEIIENSPYIFSLEDVFDRTSIIDTNIAKEILYIFGETFKDIPNHVTVSKKKDDDVDTINLHNLSIADQSFDSDISLDEELLSNGSISDIEPL